MTLSVRSGTSDGAIQVGGADAYSSSGNALVTDNSFSLSASLSRQVADTWAIATYRSCEYVLQVTQSTSYHIIKILVVHDGTNSFRTSYGEMFTGSKLFTVDTTINGANMELGITLSTATSATAKWHSVKVKV